MFILIVYVLLYKYINYFVAFDNLTIYLKVYVYIDYAEKMRVKKGKNHVCEMEWEMGVGTR